MKLVFFITLLFLFSPPVWSETFELVCDTPLHRNIYRFDTDSKTAAKIGYSTYEGNTHLETDIARYQTLSWDTNAENVVWVTYDYTQPDYGDVLYTNMRHGTILTIIFDLNYRYMTYTLLTRVRGRVTHYTSARKRCYSR